MKLIHSNGFSFTEIWTATGGSCTLCSAALIVGVKVLHDDRVDTAKTACNTCAPLPALKVLGNQVHRVTYQNGVTYSLPCRLPVLATDATPAQKKEHWAQCQVIRRNRKTVEKLWNSHLNMQFAFEMRIDDRDQAQDMRPMIADLHTGTRVSTYEYDSYGEGALGHSFDLENILAELHAENVLLRAANRFQAINTRSRIDASKKATYAGEFFKWGEAWATAKDTIKNNYAQIKENDDFARRLVGELRARSTESLPYTTVFNTSDIAGPGSVAPEGYEFEYDPQFCGFDCAANITTRKKAFTPKKAAIDPVTGKTSGVVRRRAS